MSMTLHALILFLQNLVTAIPATLGVAAVGILLACALGCACAPCRANDRLFNREVY